MKKNNKILGSITLLSFLMLVGMSKNVVASEIQKKDTEAEISFKASKEPLTIDFAPNLNFSSNEISVYDQVYNATIVDSENKNMPVYVQVTDNRGALSGWDLDVKQNGQFESVSTNHELKGAVIEFKNGELQTDSLSQPGQVTEAFKLDPSGSIQKVMNFSKNQGAGTWKAVFGNESTVEDKGDFKVTNSLQLTVPGNSEKVSDTYKTSFTWILSDVPSN
ncbi:MULTISPECIES: WxL domain-containing protein [Vagococcus]|uniref:Extracellular protein n=1 Tax=Vagococcus fluvialis bH819 TaxID=1255619 RepID=A0A1X8XKX9_9ENTE|nr:MULTISPECIES: WxL domain-containing protein [Vagococcus]SLM84609.1 extracellular protein [Vagococcus fluvialis bH819]HCM89927.1 WxL domain-containing protein [Vagococcus sp.]